MKTLYTLVVLGAISIATFCGIAMAADVHSIEEPSKLTVRGEAILKVKADQLRLNIGITTEDETAEAALDKNSAVMKDVIEALKKAGLSEDAYSTGRFQIQPRWSPRPRHAVQNWRPQIVGYTVTNRLNVKTTETKLAGRLISAATRAGANVIDSIFFDLADPGQYRGSAIRKATANAISDARVLADAASVRLVKIFALNLDNTATTPVRMRAEMKMAPMAFDSEPPISAGQVTVRASVTVVYQIE